VTKTWRLWPYDLCEECGEPDLEVLSEVPEVVDEVEDGDTVRCRCCKAEGQISVRGSLAEVEW